MERTGMLATGTIRDINDSYDEVWLIVRSLKSMPKAGRCMHVPELSPSKGLFHEYLRMRDAGQWCMDSYMGIYTPQFLKEMHGKDAVDALNELYVKTVREKKRILAACFCTDESLCHRRLVKGLLGAVGCPVQGGYEPWVYGTYKNTGLA